MIQFFCPAYDTWLSRGACGVQWKRANSGSESLDVKVGRSKCTGCLIGETHAGGGEASDVRTRELMPHDSALGPGRKPRKRLALTVLPAEPSGRTERTAEDDAPPAGAQGEEREERTMAKTYTANGETKTLDEWAKKLGMSEQAIRNRIKAGWPVEAALTTPKGGAPPAKDAKPKGNGAATKARAAERKTRKRPKRSAQPRRERAKPQTPKAAGLTPSTVLELAGWSTTELGSTPDGVLLLVKVA